MVAPLDLDWLSSNQGILASEIARVGSLLVVLDGADAPTPHEPRLSPDAPSSGHAPARADGASAGVRGAARRVRPHDIRAGSRAAVRGHGARRQCRRGVRGGARRPPAIVPDVQPGVVQAAQRALECTVAGGAASTVAPPRVRERRIAGRAVDDPATADRRTRPSLPDGLAGSRREAVQYGRSGRHRTGCRAVARAHRGWRGGGVDDRHERHAGRGAVRFRSRERQGDCRPCRRSLWLADLQHGGSVSSVQCGRPGSPRTAMGARDASRLRGADRRMRRAARGTPRHAPRMAGSARRPSRRDRP